MEATHTPILKDDIRLLTGSFQIASHTGATTARYGLNRKMAKAVIFLGDVDMRKGHDIGAQISRILRVAASDVVGELLTALKDAVADSPTMKFENDPQALRNWVGLMEGRFKAAIAKAEAA